VRRFTAAFVFPSAERKNKSGGKAPHSKGRLRLIDDYTRSSIRRVVRIRLQSAQVPRMMKV